MLAGAVPLKFGHDTNASKLVHTICTAAATVTSYRWVATAQQTFPSAVLASKLKAGLAAAVFDEILQESDVCFTPLVTCLPASRLDTGKLPGLRQ